MDDYNKHEQQMLADNEMLDRINSMKIIFFQNMSHNFKTPLTVISTSLHNIADMISFGSIDTDDMAVIVENAQREVMRLSKMLDSTMKNMSLYDNRQRMEAVSTIHFIYEMADMYRAVAERRFNRFNVTTPPLLPPIHGNKEMLTHVMANLLSNANRYTTNGNIDVNAYEKDSHIIIIVRDSGTGIKPELLPHIFERGVSEGGTGLGLPICKMTIEEVHNGTISVESSDKGTMFTITLPIYKNEDEHGK